MDGYVFYIDGEMVSYDEFWEVLFSGMFNSAETVMKFDERWGDDEYAPSYSDYVNDEALELLGNNFGNSFEVEGAIYEIREEVLDEDIADDLFNDEFPPDWVWED